MDKIIVLDTANIISSILNSIRYKFISKFPDNYFKRVYVTTEYKENFIDKDEDNIERVESPALSITSNHSYQTEDDSLFFSFRNKHYHSNLLKILKYFNDDEYLFISSRLDTLFIENNYKIKVSSRSRQMNMERFLLSTFRCNDLFRESITYEIIISDDIINRISKLLNIQIMIDDDVNDKFLKLLNSISSYPITYKYMPQYDKKYFAFILNSNVQFEYEVPSIDNDNQGNIEKDYIVEMNVKCKSNVLNQLYYKDNFNLDIDKLPDPIYQNVGEHSYDFPDLYDENIYRNILHSEYEPEFNENGEDIINLRDLLDNYKFIKPFIDSLSVEKFDEFIKIEYYINKTKLKYGDKFKVVDNISTLYKPDIIRDNDKFGIYIYMNMIEFNKFKLENNYEEID